MHIFRNATFIFLFYLGGFLKMFDSKTWKWMFIRPIAVYLLCIHYVRQMVNI